ncbi:MAG: DUF1793 domain-containing protein [Isosphaeraceae bacterium]
MRGDAATAEKYQKMAREMARKWMTMADAGDHYRLTFDPGNTWSQKYNLVWDKILKLDIFPAEVVARELAFYPKVMQKYGLPLDSRKMFTKTDWTAWTASLAPDRAGFEKFIDPLWKFANETPDRVPFSDYYWADSGKNAGMYARPVIGGLFIRPLCDEATWAEWAGKAPKIDNDWAPMPARKAWVSVVPDAREREITWRYTMEKPADTWPAAGFDDSAWELGLGGFGTRGTPGTVVRTEWKTADIWIRRPFDLPADFRSGGEIRLMVHHDEDAEIYLNGVLAAKVGGYTSDYQPLKIRQEALEALKPTGNTMAIHCHQTGGGQYIDAGFAKVEAVR